MLKDIAVTIKGDDLNPFVVALLGRNLRDILDILIDIAPGIPFDIEI